jgi:hypothetical protein
MVFHRGSDLCCFVDVFVIPRTALTGIPNRSPRIHGVTKSKLCDGDRPRGSRHFAPLVFTPTQNPVRKRTTAIPCPSSDHALVFLPRFFPRFGKIRHGIPATLPRIPKSFCAPFLPVHATVN